MLEDRVCLSIDFAKDANALLKPDIHWYLNELLGEDLVSRNVHFEHRCKGTEGKNLPYAGGYTRCPHCGFNLAKTKTSVWERFDFPTRRGQSPAVRYAWKFLSKGKLSETGGLYHRFYVVTNVPRLLALELKRKMPNVPFWAPSGPGDNRLRFPVHVLADDTFVRNLVEMQAQVLEDVVRRALHDHAAILEDLHVRLIAEDLDAAVHGRKPSGAGRRPPAERPRVKLAQVEVYGDHYAADPHVDVRELQAAASHTLGDVVPYRRDGWYGFTVRGPRGELVKVYIGPDGAVRFEVKFFNRALGKERYLGTDLRSDLSNQLHQLSERARRLSDVVAQDTPSINADFYEADLFCLFAYLGVPRYTRDYSRAREFVLAYRHGVTFTREFKIEKKWQENLIRKLFERGCLVKSNTGRERYLIWDRVRRLVMEAVAWVRSGSRRVPSQAAYLARFHGYVLADRDLEDFLDDVLCQGHCS